MILTGSRLTPLTRALMRSSCAAGIVLLAACDGSPTAPVNPVVPGPGSGRIRPHPGIARFVRGRSRGRISVFERRSRVVPSSPGLGGSAQPGVGRGHPHERHLGLDRPAHRRRVRAGGAGRRSGVRQSRGSRETPLRGPAPPDGSGPLQRLARRQGVRRSRLHRGRREPTARPPGVRPSSAPRRRGPAGDGSRKPPGTIESRAPTTSSSTRSRGSPTPWATVRVARRAAAGST